MPGYSATTCPAPEGSNAGPQSTRSASSEMGERRRRPMEDVQWAASFLKLHVG